MYNISLEKYKSRKNNDLYIAPSNINLRFYIYYIIYYPLLLLHFFLHNHYKIIIIIKLFKL